VQKVAKHLVDHGHDGLVVSGTTGESPTTTIAEDAETLAAVRDAVGDRAKIVAGIGTNDTRATVELAEQAEKTGADGLLLVTPYYNKPGQRGILEHFRTVASATDVPVILYDVPGRTGSAIGLDAYREAITWDAVVAVKEAAGDLARGVISVVGHVAGDLLRTMVDAAAAGDLATARQTYARMLPAIDAVMGVPNYGATTAKAALELLGVLDNRRVRQPLVALDEDEVAALRDGLAAAGLV
jgi:4-hydroxy-tetrahydrodipicolinate synthase